MRRAFEAEDRRAPCFQAISSSSSSPGLSRSTGQQTGRSEATKAVDQATLGLNRRRTHGREAFQKSLVSFSRTRCRSSLGEQLAKCGEKLAVQSHAGIDQLRFLPARKTIKPRFSAPVQQQQQRLRADTRRMHLRAARRKLASNDRVAESQHSRGLRSANVIYKRRLQTARAAFAKGASMKTSSRRRIYGSTAATSVISKQQISGSSRPMSHIITYIAACHRARSNVSVPFY